MNDKDRAGQQKRNAENYLAQTQHRYAINPATGIYEPRTENRTNNTEKNPYQESPTQERPLANRAEITVVFIYGIGLLVSIATLIGLIYTVGFSMKQWQETQRTADAAIISAEISAVALEVADKSARDQSRSANTQTDIARQSLHVGNDPILIVPSDIMRTLQPISVRLEPNTFQSVFEYKNIGRTPAISVIVTSLIDIKGGADLPPIPNYDGLSGDVIAAGDTKPITASVPSGNKTILELGGIGSNRSGFSILGYVQYKDLFEKKHVTAFCNFYPFYPGTGNTPRQCKGGNWFEHPPSSANTVTASRR